MIAIRPINSNHNRNGQLKIIARRRKSLRTTQFVTEAEFPTHPNREEEYGEEIDEQGCGDTEDAGYLVDDAVALRGEEDDDGVEETD